MSLQGKVETELTACTKGCATCNSSRKKRLLGEVLKAAAKVAGCEEVVKLIVNGTWDLGKYVVTATVEHVITNPESASEAVLQGVKMATELCTC